MAGQTLSNADSALKEFYEAGAREELNNDIPLLGQIESTSRNVEGRRVVLSLHTGRSSGVGARLAGGTLPTAGAQSYKEERVPLKRNYGRIQVDGDLIKAMASDRGSFVRAVDSEMKGITIDLKRDVSRQFWGASDGKVATCTTTTNNAVVNLAAATTAVQMRYFADSSFRVDIGTAANPTLRVAGALVTSVDETNLTLTLDQAVTTAGTDFVFRSGAVTAAGIAETTGLQTIVNNTGTLHNVDPAVTGVWKARVDSSVGSLNENIMAKSVQGIQIKSGMYPKLGICSDGVHRAYSAVLTSMKRSVNTTTLKGGYAGLSFTASGPELQIVWDRDCPASSLFWLNTDHLVQYQMSDWEFMQEDGAILSRVSGVDAYEATLFKYHELATDQRNSMGLMSGITEA